MNQLLRVSMLALVVLTACETRSRATELRDRSRLRRGATWVEKWNAAQEKADLWRERLELCFAARDGAETSPISMTEVRASCDADTRTLEGATRIDPTADQLGARWAREELKDAHLALVLTCRAATGLPNDAPAQLACAERNLEAKTWPAARSAYLVAFDHATPEQQCFIVQRIDQNSPTAAQDVAPLPLDVVRKCRASASSGSSIRTAEPIAPRVEPTERAAPAPPREAPVDEEKREGPGLGLQLNGDLGVGNQGLSLGVGVGFSGERFALSATPGFGFASATTGTLSVQTTSLSLAVAARFYLQARREKELAAYLRPEVIFGFASGNTAGGVAFMSTMVGFLGLGAGVGGEYLVTSRFGLTLELGLRALFTPTVDAATLGVSGSLGVMLHQ